MLTLSPHPHTLAHSLSSNKLTELPAAIANLTALTTLDVDDNPLQLPPRAVAMRGLDAIRAYFKDLEAGTAIARTCMLVLLGDAEMGKTSLLNGLLNDCAPDPALAGPEGRTIHVSHSRSARATRRSSSSATTWAGSTSRTRPRSRRTSLAVRSTSSSSAPRPQPALRTRSGCAGGCTSCRPTRRARWCSPF